MKKLLGIFLCCFSTLSLWAGKASYTVEAHASAEPEYVEVSVAIVSTCFSDIDKLNGTHDSYVHHLTEKLQADKTDEFNGYKIKAGVISPYEHREWDHQTNKDKISCSNTYQKSTAIIYKTSNLEGIGAWISTLHKHTAEVFHGAGGDYKNQDTSVTIHAPSAKICEETQDELTCKALSKAHKKAWCQFKAEFGRNAESCDAHVICAHEPGASGYRGGESLATPNSLGSGGDVSVNYSFDAITVWVTRCYEFEFGDETSVFNNSS
jgi:hypothetical protein